MVNRQELIKTVAESMSKTKKETEAFLHALESVITEYLAQGKDVKFGIGTFKRAVKKGRSGISKLQGVEKEWSTEDSFKPTFKASKMLKEAVAKSK